MLLCCRYCVFTMMMLARGYTPKELLSTFFPIKDKTQRYKNDLRVSCFLGAVFNIPDFQKYILDLDFLVKRHTLDTRPASKKKIALDTGKKYIRRR